MSCVKDAEKCTGTAGSHGQPEAMATWASGRGATGHCDKCGGFLTDEGTCNNPRCGVLTLSTGEQTSIDEGASLAGFLRDSGLDPLNNEGVRRLHQNYVSIATGVDREVIMDPDDTPTAATDLRGKVYLNPYPLGEKGAIIDQLLITQMYIDHELGHELFTPLDLLKSTIAISGNQPSFSPRGADAARWRKIWQGANDLSAVERKMLHSMVNVVEDARMERVIESQEPYMWKQMLAGQLIQPKDGHARNGGMMGMPPHEQVLWATQIVGQSNYALTTDIQAGMSDEALQTIRDLMPVIDRGVRGNAFDSLEVSIEIVRDMKRRGMLDGGVELTRPNPDNFSGSRDASGEKSAGDDSPPAGGESSSSSGGGDEGKDGESGSSSGGDEGKDGKGGSSSGGSGKETEQCPKCGAFLDKNGHCNKCGGAGTGKKDGDSKDDASSSKKGDTGAGGGTTKDSKGTGAPGLDDRDASLSTPAEMRRLEKDNEEARKKLSEMRDIMTGQYQKAVKKLITNAEKHLAKALAKAANNPPKTISLPILDEEENMLSRQYKLHPHNGLVRNRMYQIGLVDKNREVISRGAARMAGRLKKMKQKVQRDAYMQKRGTLDRRRMVAIVKGSDRVRLQQADRHDTSMAVTMSFDISGSMSPYQEELGTIAGMIGRGLEKANVPYEFRAYSAEQYHVKAFEHKRISDEQVGSLYNTMGANCDAPSLTMGGYALQTREEAAKIQFVLTDGQPQSFIDGSYGQTGMKEVRNAVAANRAKGILTMGIFFAGPSSETKEKVKPMFDFMYGEGNWMYVPELNDVPEIITGTLEKQLAKFLPNF